MCVHGVLKGGGGFGAHTRVSRSARFSAVTAVPEATRALYCATATASRGIPPWSARTRSASVPIAARSRARCAICPGTAAESRAQDSADPEPPPLAA